MSFKLLHAKVSGLQLHTKIQEQVCLGTKISFNQTFFLLLTKLCPIVLYILKKQNGWRTFLLIIEIGGVGTRDDLDSTIEYTRNVLCIYKKYDNKKKHSLIFVYIVHIERSSTKQHWHSTSSSNSLLPMTNKWTDAPIDPWRAGNPLSFFHNKFDSLRDWRGVIKVNCVLEYYQTPPYGYNFFFESCLLLECCIDSSNPLLAFNNLCSNLAYQTLERK